MHQAQDVSKASSHSSSATPDMMEPNAGRRMAHLNSREESEISSECANPTANLHQTFTNHNTSTNPFPPSILGNTDQASAKHQHQIWNRSMHIAHQKPFLFPTLPSGVNDSAYACREDRKPPIGAIHSVKADNAKETGKTCVGFSIEALIGPEYLT